MGHGVIGGGCEDGNPPSSACYPLDLCSPGALRYDTMDSSAPLAPLSASNRGPLIIVATYILLTISLFAVTVKTWTRLSNARLLLATDRVMLAGAVLAVAQAIALTMSIKCGLGVRASDLKDEQVANVKKALYAASILTLAVLTAAKASVVLLLVAIQPPKPVVTGSYVFVGAAVAWFLSGSIAIIFQCHPPSMAFSGAPNDEICVDRYALQLSLGVVDILTDVIVVALAYFTVRGVQITLRRRASIVALFGLRLITPACTIGAIIAYGKYWHQQPRDTTRDIVVPLLWSQGALHASIVTACIPSIKRFFMSAQSGLMGVQITEQYELTHASRKGTRSTALSQNESRSEPRVEKGTTSNTEQPTGHDAHHPSPGVYTGSEEAQSRTRVRGGLPKEQAEETESMRGLTSDVIHERREFTLDYADEGSRHSSMK